VSSEYDKESLGEGLEELARDGSLELSFLRDLFVNPESFSGLLHGLIAQTASFEVGNVQQRAIAFRNLLEDEIRGLENGGESPSTAVISALLAGFRIDRDRYEDDDLFERRLDHARLKGDFGENATQDTANRHWTTGIDLLARNLQGRFSELFADPDRWHGYLRGHDPTTPADAQPFFIECLVATYNLTGRMVESAVTERVVRAEGAKVDCYIVRATTPFGRRDKVRVRALLNCREGPAKVTLDGRSGEIHEIPIFFPNVLAEGESCFFSTEVTGQFNDDPIVEVQVTSVGIAAGGLTLRVQFDKGYHPADVWWFADVPDANRLIKPVPGSDNLLRCSSFGYVSHTFDDPCKPKAKYGIAWDWGTQI